MAGLKEQAIWENEIYQIEENDPVHGGEEGITNKPTKQLANRTLYLRNLLILAGQKIVPKTITATSTNTADETGHTHAIDHATTRQKGIVQLTNDTGLDSEALALTAKAGKKLAQEIAQNRQKTVDLANQKVNKSDVSDAVNSTSQTQVASSLAVKTAHDKALQAERLAQLYSADVSEYIDCNQAMEGMFTTRVGTPDGEICYVLNLKYKHSNSRGQIAISYWDTNPKIWIRNKYDTEPHFSAWMRVDGADWDNIRNKVNASLTKYGLAQYRDDINLDSSDFAATPKAVKLLNDKKQDKLVQQTLDLTRLDPNKWYPVILKMPNVRKLYQFAVRRTLGDGNNPTWATHGDGFSTYCEWETQPSQWGAYPYIDPMRLIRQFTFAYCHQSPMLKIGQINQASWEYIYLRGGTSYTLSRESDVAVEIGTNGYRWQHVSGQYSHDLPIITSYDESLVPKNTRQALKDEIDTKATRATTLAGYGISDFVVNTYRGDLNTLRVDGIYSINSYADAQNMPVSSSGHVIVICGGASNQRWCRQIYKPHYSGTTYERWQTSNTDDEWSEWVRTDGVDWVNIRNKPVVSRRDYSRIVRGTNANWDSGTSQNISVTGYVEIRPDGKIEQHFYFHNFRVWWFNYEPIGGEHAGPKIPVQLWTAMPNKVTYVSGHFSRNVASGIAAGAEGTEWNQPTWAFEEQGNSKDRCSLYARRLAGGSSEHIDMYIKVEGY